MLLPLSGSLAPQMGENPLRELAAVCFKPDGRGIFALLSGLFPL
jgi:hypothetical protein